MNTFLWAQVLGDTISDHSRVRLTPNEISLHCSELARSITKSFIPDLIVAIDTGGSVPGDTLAKELGIPVEHLVIRRTISIGRMYNADPIPLRWIMSLYHHYLFHTTQPVISKGLKIDITGKKILVVDDAFHTGKTASIAVKYLKDNQASEVKTATLSYVSEKRPDFSILPAGNYCFPWSKDYMEVLDSI